MKYAIAIGGLSFLLYLGLRSRRNSIFLRDGQRGKIQIDGVTAEVRFLDIASPLVSVYFKIIDAGVELAEEIFAIDPQERFLKLFPSDSVHDDYPYILMGELMADGGGMKVSIGKKLL